MLERTIHYRGYWQIIYAVSQTSAKFSEKLLKGHLDWCLDVDKMHNTKPEEYGWVKE